MSHQAEKYEKLNNIIELVSESEISSIKNVVSSISQCIADPKSTAKDLKQIIEVDPPLTANVLRLAIHLRPKPTCKKNPAADKPVSYTQISSKAFNLPNHSPLTLRSALDIYLNFFHYVINWKRIFRSHGRATKLTASAATSHNFNHAVGSCTLNQWYIIPAWLFSLEIFWIGHTDQGLVDRTGD